MVTVQREHTWPSASWEEAEAFARHIADSRGCAIDGGIRETVIALNLLGLPTCQSCEGHLDYGLPYPWIDIETNEFPAFKQALEDADREGLSEEEREAKGTQLMALAATLPSRSLLYTRLENLLCTYQQQHLSIPEEWHIIAHRSSPILFRIMPFCGYDAEEWPEDARAEKLARAQTAMQALANWLREQWQNRACLSSSGD